MHGLNMKFYNNTLFYFYLDDIICTAYYLVLSFVKKTRGRSSDRNVCKKSST